MVVDPFHPCIVGLITYTNGSAKPFPSLDDHCPESFRIDHQNACYFDFDHRIAVSLCIPVSICTCPLDFL